MLGAGCKLIGNVAAQWMQNSAEERRVNALRDAEATRAHVELVKETSRNVISSVSRAIIFCMLAGTWCYMGVAGIGSDITTTVLIPSEGGWFARMLSHQSLKPVEIKGTTLLYQWWQIMEMMMGAFVMPSRKS